MSKTNTSLTTHDLPSLLTLLAAALLAGYNPVPIGERHTPAPPGEGELVINEILYDPANGHPEFIELYNGSDRPLDISSLRLSDNRREPAALLGDRFLLAAGAFAVISETALSPVKLTGEVLTFTTDSWPALNNGGDTVILYAGSAVIDSAAYEPAFGAPDRSLERIDPRGPSSYPANWAASTDPDGATPGRRNSVYDPDTRPPELLLAEQSAAATITLHFDEPLRHLDRTDIACDKPLRITDLRFRENRREITLSLSAAPVARTCTIDTIEDLSGNHTEPQTVPLAYMPESFEIAITELMYEPLADPFDNRPDQPEYLELYNRSDRSVTTTGMFWTNRPNEDGTADTTHLPSIPAAIPSGGHAVIFAAPEETRGSALRQAFPGPMGSVLLLPIQKQSLGLRNGGQSIRLHGRNHMLIDSLRYSPVWHHPDLVDPRGIALERIAIDGGSNAPDNWTSSVDPSGGSPGRENTVVAPSPVPAEADRLTIDPSPFSPNGDGYDDHTVLSYHLPQLHASIRIRIFDARGRLVRRLAPARLSAASESIVWNGRDDRQRVLPAGIYVVLLEAVDAGGGLITRCRAPVVIGDS